MIRVKSKHSPNMETTEFQETEILTQADCEKSQKIYRKNLSSKFCRETEDSMKIIRKINQNRDLFVLIFEIEEIQIRKVQNFLSVPETFKNS